MHAFVARSTFPGQNVQNTWGTDTHGRPDVEKVQAVVARSTLPSQNVQNTWGTDHFWTSRSRPAHFQGKMCKTPGVRTAFWTSTCPPPAQKVNIVVARNTCPGQNEQNTWVRDRSWTSRCRPGTPLWREAHFQVKRVKSCSF